METEVEPTSAIEKSRYFNRMDEAFGILCLSISPEMLFHVESCSTPNEVWKLLERLFGKQDEIWQSFLFSLGHFDEDILHAPVDELVTKFPSPLIDEYADETSDHHSNNDESLFEEDPQALLAMEPSMPMHAYMIEGSSHMFGLTCLAYMMHGSDPQNYAEANTKAIEADSARADTEETGSLTDDQDSNSSSGGKSVSSYASSSLADQAELERKGSGISVISFENIRSTSCDEEKSCKTLPSSQYKGVVPQPNGRWGAQIYETHRREIKKVQDRIKTQRPKSDGMICTRRRPWVEVSMRHSEHKLSHRFEVDLSHLTDIVWVDRESMLIKCEPMVCMSEVSAAVLPLGMAPQVLPELDDLTVGGVINGYDIEGSNHLFGLFSDTCVAYELVLADGSLVRVTADNEYSDLFHAVPWSHGSIGLLVGTEFRLTPVKEYMKVTYSPVTGTLDDIASHYLKKKVTCLPPPASIIADIDLYKHDPWDLPAKPCFGEQEWYFFSLRNRKYPNGLRSNRSAGSGYWKATATDRPIVVTSGSTSSQEVGMNKSLVFYKGSPLKGLKTNWIMHEYCLAETTNRKGSMRLDYWVLCRIYRKATHPSKVLPCPERDPPSLADVQQKSAMPNFGSSSRLLQSESLFMERFLSHDTSDANAIPFYMEPSSSLYVVPEQQSMVNWSNPRSPVSMSQLGFNGDEASSIYAATEQNTQNPSHALQFQSWNPYVVGAMPDQLMYQLPFSKSCNPEPPAWTLPPGNVWSSDDNG